MKLIKDCWAWIKEWNEWGMKDWLKAGIICAVVLFIIYNMTAGGPPSPSQQINAPSGALQKEITC